MDAHDWMRWCAEKMHAVASERVNLAGFQHSLGAAALVSGVEVRSLLGVGAPERMSAYVSAESVVAHYVDVKLHSQPSGAFFINLRHFMKLRVTMDARWVLVKGRAAIEAIQPVEDTPMNDAQTMDALYAGAERAKDAFSAYVERIAKQVGADFAVAPLKGKDRAAAKIRDDYGGTVGRLVDVLRAKFVVTSGDAACVVMAALRPDTVRIKNRCRGTLSGYRDILVNVRVSGHVGEVQVHFHCILAVDQEFNSHIAYEFFRSYYRGNVAAIKDMLQTLLHLRQHVVRGQSLRQFVDAVLADTSCEPHWHALGAVLEDISELALALRVRRRQCVYAKHEYGPEGESTLSAFVRLGTVFYSMGQLEKAKEMYERVLKGQEKALGSQHPDTLRTARSFANLLERMGDVTRAHSLRERMR